MAVHLVPVDADLSLLHSRRVPHLSQTVSRELFVDVIAKIRSGGQHQGQKAIKPLIPIAKKTHFGRVSLNLQTCSTSSQHTLGAEALPWP